jgi:hypothetical protein
VSRDDGVVGKRAGSGPAGTGESSSGMEREIQKSVSWDRNLDRQGGKVSPSGRLPDDV